MSNTISAIIAAIFGSVVTMFLSWLFSRDKSRIRVRTVVRGSESVPHAFMFEVANCGTRDITVVEFGFVDHRHEETKAVVVNRLDYDLSVHTLPAVIPPGQIRRLQFLAGDLSLYKTDPVRPFIYLATGRRIEGRQRFPHPCDFFHYNRPIGKMDDIIRY